MYWVLCFIISALCFMISVFFAFMRMRSKYKSGRLLDITKILLIGTVVSSVVLFIPIYRNAFKSTDCGLFETVFLSIHNMIRLFVVDGDFGFITDNIASQADWIQRAYSVLFAILFVMAPVLTFGFVMSFFKNAFAHLKYIANYNSDIFVFSELNERSLALARSLSDKPERRLFVFTDVFEKENEQSFELSNGAKELGAICFKKDILAIDFSLHSKHSEINFFAIGDDQTENISQTLKIASDYRYRENTNLYLFDSGIESEILIVNAFEDDNDRTPAIKIRRVNEVQSLVNRNLYECGYEKIFKSARDKGECKKISAVIIGMGQHGTEMTKALSWFCQMDGYETEINAFDIKENAAEHFKSQCPELMDDRYNGRFDTDGEAKYKITVHSGIDADTLSFDNMMLSMTDATYVFVALGSDDKNIACAIKLRSLFERNGSSPVIQAVVYDSDKKNALAGVKNFKGQEFDIDFIGDIDYSYSEEVILNSDVEKKALERHMKWGKESDFWRYAYNYKSSVASAIHRKMKILCGIPGIEKNPEERTEEERWAIRKLEHCRWNAYMRSQGYCYAEKRNDLAKTHHCLVPFDELSEAEQKKDDD